MSSFRATIDKGKATLSNMLNEISLEDSKTKLKKVLSNYDETVKNIDFDMSKMRDKITKLFEENINQDTLSNAAQRVRDMNVEFLEWAKHNRLKITDLIDSSRSSFSKWWDEGVRTIKEWASKAADISKEWYTKGSSRVNSWFDTLKKTNEQ